MQNSEKYVLITGATSGIGLQTAKDLLNMGYKVLGTSRSKQKEDEAKKILGDNFYFIRGDLSSRKSLDNIAAKTKEYIGETGLYALVNNAGTFFSQYTLSEDNIEMQFAVNTTAPMYLSLMLYAEINKAHGRIVNVSSNSHYRTIINWNDMQLNKNYGHLRAYKQTKALSVLLSRAFNMFSSNVKMYMADPGLVCTDIGYKNASVIGKLVWSYRRRIAVSVKEGAATSVYLVDSNSLPDELYFKYCKVKKSSKVTQCDKNAIKIWDYFFNLYNIKAEDYIK